MLVDTATHDAPTSAPTGEDRPKRAMRPARAPAERSKVAQKAVLQKQLREAREKLKQQQQRQELRELEPEPPPHPPAADGASPSSADIATPTETPLLEPGQRPGWPPPSLVAQYEPMAMELWQTFNAMVLSGTPFELKPRHAESGPTVHPVEVLAKATAPVAAKYLPKVADTPEAMLGAALAMAFGAPLVAFVRQWMEQRERQQQQDKAAAVPRAV